MTRQRQLDDLELWESYASRLVSQRRIQSAHLTTSGSDCGEDSLNSDAVVEVGWLRGSGSTVWFVHDPVRTRQLPGCATGCTMGGYRMTWSTTGQGISFSNYVGLGDEAGGMAETNV